jgi:YD repeat-containing protein
VKGFARDGHPRSGLLTTAYGYDGLGVLTTMQYPNSVNLTYTLDSLERPISLTDASNYSWASGVQYNPAGQMTIATFPSGAETWGYNTLSQLTTRTTISGSTKRMNMTYNYAAGTDNGQIASTGFHCENRISNNRPCFMVLAKCPINGALVNSQQS